MQKQHLPDCRTNALHSTQVPHRTDLNILFERANIVIFFKTQGGTRLKRGFFAFYRPISVNLSLTLRHAFRHIKHIAHGSAQNPKETWKAPGNRQKHQYSIM